MSSHNWKTSSFLSKCYKSNAKIIIIIDKGKSLVNNPITDISISRFANEHFEIGIRGNLLVDLDTSKPLIADGENKDVNENNISWTIRGSFRAEPSRQRTY